MSRAAGPGPDASAPPHSLAPKECLPPPAPWRAGWGEVGVEEERPWQGQGSYKENPDHNPRREGREAQFHEEAQRLEGPVSELRMSPSL